MTPLALVLLGVASIAAVVDWIAVWKGGRRAAVVERVAKPLVIVALLLMAVTWPVEGNEAASVRPWLVAALAASLAGDVLLLPPGRFVAGLAAFLLAHLAYLAAFALLPGSVPLLVAGLAAAALALATVGRMLVSAARQVGLGIPVALYMAAICAMAVAATRSGLPAAVIGAWLFVASDAMIGWGRFRSAEAESSRGPAVLRTAVMVTYHAGQVLLVGALLVSPGGS